MKTLIIGIALAIVLPAAAHAQAAPKVDCCEKMEAEGKKCCCCDDMDKKDHADHDMSKMDHGPDKK